MSIRINAGASAYDETQDRTITVIRPHFSDYLCQVSTDITDDDCEVIGEDIQEQIFTQRELDRFFGGHVVFGGRDYRIKDEFEDAWNASGIVNEDEIARLADEWGIPVSELMEQVEEV